MAPILATDVLVIGGGMAGGIAALAARKSGAEVVVARKAFGATALSSGAVDVAPDPAAAPGDWAAHLVPIELASQEIARTRPYHPYAVLRSSLPRLRESLDFAISKLGGLLCAPGPKNMFLMSPLGTFKPTAMAQRQQQAGDVVELPEHVAIVELGLVPDFDAKIVAQGLRNAAAHFRRPASVTVVESRLLGDSSDALQPGYALARKIQDLPIDRVAQRISEVLPANTQLVFFPPLMGVDRAWFENLVDRLKIPCAEFLSSAPSVPGLRLQQAVDQALSENGIRLLDGEVHWNRNEKAAAIGETTLKTRSLVLATGKFVGGGIARHGFFREAVFDIPVFSGGRRLGDQFIGQVLGDRMNSDQPAFRAGIRIDEALRPIDVPREMGAENLYAAGSVIAGYDPAADKTGLGVAIFTGYLAGENAAESNAMGTSSS